MTTHYTQRMHSGAQVDVMNLKTHDIHLEDIAHNLSHQCRFNGGTVFHYSVAQHSVYCAAMALEQIDPQEPSTVQALRRILLHDASEAYLGDVVRPIKYTELFALYRVVEVQVQDTIYNRFDLVDIPLPLPFRNAPGEDHWEMTDALCRDVDDRMCAIECRRLFSPPYIPDLHYGLPDASHDNWRGVIAWCEPEAARRLFLRAYRNPLEVLKTVRRNSVDGEGHA